MTNLLRDEVEGEINLSLRADIKRIAREFFLLSNTDRAKMMRTLDYLYDDKGKLYPKGGIASKHFFSTGVTFSDEADRACNKLATEIRGDLP